MSKKKQSSESVNSDESSIGMKIFNAFVENPEITVTEDELMSYALNELNLPRESMSQEFKENLPVILITFMNTWSGWHSKNDYLAGFFGKEHYFERFQKFILHKMNHIMRSQFNSAMRALGYPVNGEGNGEKNDSEFFPYTISIQCPPHMLNTIVFSNSGEDVLMKQHLGSAWQDLTTTQLLNWPFVEVSIRTPDIWFIRRQSTEFTRYLNFLPHESSRFSESILEQVETMANYGNIRTCYSYNILEKYIRLYLTTVKSFQQHVPLRKFEEISAIFTTFLEDVKYIDINNSMATNTAVLFRLSKMPFIRNKKLVKNPEKEAEEARVGYCEIISPKIELILMHFKAIQIENTEQLSFEYIEKLKSSPPGGHVVPFISYKCLFCNEEFTLPDAQKCLMTHLKAKHKMEQHVRCTMCKKQFDVINLSACRWRHKCVVSNNT